MKIYAPFIVAIVWAMAAALFGRVTAIDGSCIILFLAGGAAHIHEQGKRVSHGRR